MHSCRQLDRECEYTKELRIVLNVQTWYPRTNVSKTVAAVRDAIERSSVALGESDTLWYRHS
jgi:hypothetical protein